MQCPVMKLKTFLCSNVPGGPRCWHPTVFGFPAVFASVLLMPSLLLLCVPAVAGDPVVAVAQLLL